MAWTTAKLAMGTIGTATSLANVVALGLANAQQDALH